MPRKKPVYSPSSTSFVLNNSGPEAIIKREVSTEIQRNQLENTLIYGDDDALPLRIARIVNRSPATKACIDTRAKYIKGAGFSDPTLEKLIVDKNGTTLWQLHTMLAETLSLFDGFAVNFKFDAQGKITNTYCLGFESCRLTKPDDYGFIPSIKYNPYFGTAQYKQEFTTEYHVFDSQQAINQIEQYGTAFKGQVFYYGRTSPIYRFYPVPSYWSAESWINVDADIQTFHANNLKKGFFQTLMFNAIGDPSQPSKNPKYQRTVTGDDGVKRTESTKTVGEEFGIAISEGFAGAEKAGSGMTFWSQNHDTAVKMAAFPSNQNHELFTTLQELTDEKITQATLVPGILANIQRGVNLGSGGSEIQKAVELMLSRTEEERQLLENFYNEVIFPNMAVPPTSKVEIKNFNPVSVPIEINDKLWEQFTSKEKREFTKQNIKFNFDQETADSAPSKRTLIEVIGIGGSQSLMGILQQFADGKLTETQAVNIMQILFGINEIDAKRMVQKEAPQVLPDGTVAPVIAPTEPTEQINENLKNLNLADITRVQKIVARFNLSKTEPDNAKALTLDQAKQFLASYGFTEEQINAWLVTENEL